MPVNVHNAMETFPVLTPAMDLHTLPWTGGMEFYEGLESRFGGFDKHVLISCHAFEAAWPTWECHPEGDELVMLLAGTATMVLQVAGEHQGVELCEPGQYIVVPRGTWHTASAATDARMLFVTPGEGTQNLEQPPRDD